MLRSNNLRSMASLLGLVVVLGCSACSSTLHTQQEGRPIQQPAIAPGSVRLDASLGSCDVRGRWYDCEADVALVQEYGSGTEQLPSGTAIQFSVLRSMQADLLRDDSELFDRGTKLVLELAYTRDTNTEANIPAWKAISIKRSKK